MCWEMNPGPPQEQLVLLTRTDSLAAETRDFQNESQEVHLLSYTPIFAIFLKILIQKGLTSACGLPLVLELIIRPTPEFLRTFDTFLILLLQQ